jgi:hypothetical protein
MSTSQCATDPDLAEPQAEPAVSKPRKNVLVGFAATVTIGLGLASWYVGVRIVDANEVAPVSRAVKTPPQVPTSPVAPALQPTVTTTSKQVHAPVVPGSAPAPAPPPDLYLQVAGLGPRQDASFMKSLAAKGYRARMIENAGSGTNPGVNQEDRRILIGPFVGRRSLDMAERKLQSAGVLALEVTY